MDARDRLAALSQDAQYDLSCACGTKDQDRRVRGPDGMWIYPASLPRGGKSIILKSLLTNACQNDCRYCPLRQGYDTPRYSLAPDEMAGMFMDYVRARGIHGLFLTSGVVKNPDYTMDRIIATASILRHRYAYRGFLHLKIIPGASEAAIETALSLASEVSLNVEAPHRRAFETLSHTKNFERDIVAPMKHISKLTARGAKYAGVKQTTQFIVGAAKECDSDIISATFGLYHRLGLCRVYFSAYQRPAGEAVKNPRTARQAEHENFVPDDLLTREHRLYQADYLLRKYKWDMKDFVFEPGGNLSLEVDPKVRWAQMHPEFFPVRLKTANRDALLRVPGLGPLTVGRILAARREYGFRSLRDVGVKGKRLEKAAPYVVKE